MTQEIELRIQTPKEEMFLAWLAKNAFYKSDIQQIDYYLDRVDNPYFYFDTHHKLQSDYWLRIRTNNDIFILKKFTAMHRAIICILMNMKPQFQI